MTKTEFLTRFTSVLEKNRIPDKEEILDEYEQHFTCKLADGYSEEEIAARLGDPEQLALQYVTEPASLSEQSGAMIELALGVTDVIVGVFFLLLAACGVVILAAAVVFFAVGVCMLVGASPYSLIPAMPYGCAAILGISLAALGVLTAVGAICYGALLRQLARSYGRFHRNAVADAKGGPVLPPLPVHVRLEPRANRRLRRLALIALLTFAVCFVLGLVVCSLSAGSLEFWHAWGWFVN